VSVTCIVSHRLGYFEENTLVGPRDDSGKKNMPCSKSGQRLTYLQRMTLKAALGLAAAEDDDAKASQATPWMTARSTEEQAATVRALIEETETDIQKFCEMMKVASVPQLASSQYGRVVASLEAKKRRLAS
jgi:hypothetical protein